MAITLGGLASGMDTNGMITALVAAESEPLTQIQSQKTALDKAKTDVSSFKSRVSDLITAAKALADPLQFNATKATSSDAAVVASAGVGATAGSYSLDVLSLAKESRSQSFVLGSSTEAVGGEGNLTIKVGADKSATFTVLQTDSLTDIASKVNSAGLRVQASVLYDGSKYRMVVRGLDTGATNAVSFDETGTLATTLGMTDAKATMQAASDSSIKLDGVTITRSTNQVVGAIPGVTLALTKPTTSPVQLTIDADSSALATKVQSFVSAYNAVVSNAHLTAGYGSTVGSDALLQGDSAFRGTLETLSRLVGGTVAGTGNQSLAAAGMTLQKDGSLSFDSSKLQSLLSKDPIGARKLFTTDAAIGATGAMGTLAKALDTIAGTSGTLQGRIDAYSSHETRLDQQADIQNRRIAAYKEQLQKQFSDMETAFSNAKTAMASLDSLLGTSSSSSSSKSSG
jgi:flagellar hook-associated protein 2